MQFQKKVRSVLRRLEAYDHNQNLYVIHQNPSEKILKPIGFLALIKMNLFYLIP